MECSSMSEHFEIVKLQNLARQGRQSLWYTHQNTSKNSRTTCLFQGKLLSKKALCLEFIIPCIIVQWAFVIP